MTNTNRYSIVKRLLVVAAATAGVLALPWIAMQFTSEVDWSATDFALAGALLLGSGSAFVLCARDHRKFPYRLSLALGIGTTLVLVWVNLAVGIIGAPDNPVNLAYYAVPLIGVVGAGLVRLRARGMALTAYAMAAATSFVTFGAWLVCCDIDSYALPSIALASGLSALPFLICGWLFRRAAKG